MSCIGIRESGMRLEEALGGHVRCDGRIDYCMSDYSGCVLLAQAEGVAIFGG